MRASRLLSLQMLLETRGRMSARPRPVAGSNPSTSMRPSRSRRAPATSESSVDLPTPSGPMSPAITPAGMSRVTASNAATLP